MKTCMLVSLTIGLLFSAANGDDPKVQEPKKLDGDWVVTSVVRNRNDLPAERLKDLRASFQSGKFSFQQGDQVLSKGTFQLDPDKAPKRIDLTWTDSDGKPQTTHAVYELSEDRLKICGAKPGAERPSEFGAADANGHTLTSFRRAKP